MGFSVLTEHSRLTQEIIFWYRVYRAGSASKEFTEICISADCCNDLYSKFFLSRLDNLKGIYTEIFKL